MNKLILPILMLSALTACDKKISNSNQTKMICSDFIVLGNFGSDKLDLYFTDNSNGIYTMGNIPQSLKSVTNLHIIAKNVNNSGNILNYVGQIKDSKEKVNLSLRYDSKLNSFTSVSLGFESGQYYNCKILIPVSGEKPKEPSEVAQLDTNEKNKVELCINEIYNNARIAYDKSGLQKLALKDKDGKWINIDEKKIVSVLKNWDWKTLKNYNNRDGYVYKNETDACNIVKKLQELKVSIKK